MTRLSLLSAFLPALANSTQEPPPGTGEWLKIVIYLLGIGFLLLGVIEKVRGIFGRKPPIDQDLRKVWDRLGLMEAQLAKATTDAKDAVQAQLSEIDQRRSRAISDVHAVVDREVGAVHEKVNIASIAIARVETQTEEHTRRLIHMEGRINSIADRGRSRS